MQKSLEKNRRTVKVMRMKPVPPKNKQKQSGSKAEKDYISETISFVIKGKLTPIKPTFVAKKGGAKKTAKKKEISDGKDRPMMRKAKKASDNAKVGAKVQTKTAKKTNKCSEGRKEKYNRHKHEFGAGCDQERD
jgi:hypothetical protein